ncbi:hypothetical protein LOAG_04425 [Loa loa]|uniref:Uncharacterized protein n=1 Tax=Loa loa TaxID=7209 RepID=A0A1S0U1W7_LOALO|nr:hypothetical protein LOAG_04425 [Loa loa]EFO24059.1 hypothetical protein LOAG_04425 [Loa loa]
MQETVQPNQLYRIIGTSQIPNRLSVTPPCRIYLGDHISGFKGQPFGHSRLCVYCDILRMTGDRRTCDSGNWSFTAGRSQHSCTSFVRFKCRFRQSAHIWRCKLSA